MKNTASIISMYLSRQHMLADTHLTGSRSKVRSGLQQVTTKQLCEQRRSQCQNRSIRAYEHEARPLSRWLQIPPTCALGTIYDGEADPHANAKGAP